MNAAEAATLRERASVPISHQEIANAIRALAMDAVQAANSGHPGMPMGMADVATVLATRFLKFDPREPHWPDRDRLVLSAGHGSMLLYALFYLTGYPGMNIEQLRAFRQWGSLTPGHPEYGHTPGVETTTGPLGQGLANAVGMAVAERMLAARFGPELVDHRTYVIAGDGCLMEGISHEAASLAGHLRLSRLIVLYDDNEISIDGATSLALSDDALARFAAYGWSASRIDGHDPAVIAAALERAQASERPVLIACRTVIGYGAPHKAGSAAVHGAPLGAAEVAAARERLGWPYPPFVIPSAIAAAWRATGARGAQAHEAWRERLAKTEPTKACAFEDTIAGVVGQTAFAALDSLAAKLEADSPAIASRQASQRVIEALAPNMPNLVGGSADLTHSNLTFVKTQKAVKSGDYSGNYIHFGVREHAMAAALNGIALHGGFVPYGGTFLVFSDYARPAIRLAALMGQRVIFVLTHDSIGLGEDGPTHQPIEHLVSLRAIPNLLVFRPADALETLGCWRIALAEAGRPSALCLSRQTLRPLPSPAALADIRRGAYLVREAGERRDVTLIATGSEVGVALAGAEILAAEDLAAAVVSAPCLSLFAEQPQAYRRAVLGTAPRIGVEAAAEGDWARWLGEDGVFVGMSGFGASAPAEILFEKFGITAERVAQAARAAITARRCAS